MRSPACVGLVLALDRLAQPRDMPRLAAQAKLTAMRCRMCLPPHLPLTPCCPPIAPHAPNPPACLQFTNGTVHVKATYDKSYELILMPLQAAVLLPFNDGACRAGLHPATSMPLPPGSHTFVATSLTARVRATCTPLQLRSCLTASCAS